MSAHLRARALGAGLAALLIAGLAGCRISEDQERQIGEQDAREINAQLPLVSDPRVTDYVTQLGLAIARRTERANLDWRFFVVDSREVNAFAVPGGYIYVNRGLIERTRSMDELAGVLGHEIGHVVLRHSVKQMEKTGKVNAGISLVCALSSMCSSEVTRAAISVAGTAWFARHSRHDEAAADSDAVENVVRAGISPSGIPSMFETLLQERRMQPGMVGGWFASHPLEEDRIRATRRILEGLDPRALRGLRADTQDYHRFVAYVRALPPPRMNNLPSAGAAPEDPDAPGGVEDPGA